MPHNTSADPSCAFDDLQIQFPMRVQGILQIIDKILEIFIE